MKNIIQLTLAAILLTACGSKDPNSLEELLKKETELKTELAKIQEDIKKTQGDSVKKITLVETENITEQIFKTYINVQGHVDAEQSVILTSEIPGTITKINVEAGQIVSKGTVLAETDTRASQLLLSAQQNSLALINQLYEKRKALWDQKIGTELEFLQIKTAKESMESAVAAMQEQIKMGKIISPIDGIVDAVDLKVGQTIVPGNPVSPSIRVVNFNNLKIKSDLAESYSSKVHKGDDVKIIFPDTKDSLNAKVSYASRSINPMSRTFNVEINLDNKKEYHPNQIVQIKINDYISPKPVIVLPVKYVQTDFSGKTFVLINENNKATKREVTKGKEYNGYAEIISGLSQTDNLITKGYESVNEGDLLKTNSSK